MWCFNTSVVCRNVGWKHLSQSNEIEMRTCDVFTPTLKKSFIFPTFHPIKRWNGLSSQKLYSLTHPPKIVPAYKNVLIFPEDLQHFWLSRDIPQSPAEVGRSMVMAALKAADQWAAWSAGCSRHLRALGLGPWQPPPSLLMWACTKIELGMLVALMLWLPRGLQLPLSPISVMDELHLISASPPSIYVGPWLAAWPPSKGEGGSHQTSGTLSENSAGEGESLKSAVSSRKWDLRGMQESDCRLVVLGRKWNRHNITFQQKHLSRASSFRVDLINPVIHLL